MPKIKVYDSRGFTQRYMASPELDQLLKGNFSRFFIVRVEDMYRLVLVGIAVPLKYVYGDPYWVKLIGPIHGLLFLLFVINTLAVGVEYGWKFSAITWKVLLACLVPFGTFYIDKKILAKL